MLWLKAMVLPKCASDRLLNYQLSCYHRERSARKVFVPETGIVLEDIVSAKVVEGPTRGVGLRAGQEAKVKDEACKRLVDVETVPKRVCCGFTGDVFAIVWKEPMVGERVEHGTRAPDYL